MYLMPKQSDFKRLIGEPLKNHLRSALQNLTQGTSDYDLNADQQSFNKKDLLGAAVLIAIQIQDGIPYVILTKRSSALKNHPGQVAFPGGKIDPCDATAIQAALREAQEEIALPPTQVDVLGSLPDHITITGFRVTPVVAYIECSFHPVPKTGEVDEVFRVPFDFLMHPQNYTICKRRYMGCDRRYYTVPYGPHYIWGATARILRAFAECFGA